MRQYNKTCNNEYNVMLSVEITTKTNNKTASAANGSTIEKSESNKLQQQQQQQHQQQSNDSCRKLTFFETFFRHALRLLGKLRTISNAEF